MQDELKDLDDDAQSHKSVVLRDMGTLTGTDHYICHSDACRV